MPRGEFRQHHRIKSVRGIARLLRRKPTRSESMLWEALRNRQLTGMKFLRQHPIGSSIVDFYCHEKRLAVEIDGPIHQKHDVAECDQARQKLIEAYGIRFFRCTSAEVEGNLQGILERLREACRG